MKLINRFNILILFVFLAILTITYLYISPQKAFAADVNITCSGSDQNNGQCDVVGSLFNVKDFAPGQTVIKTIQATNTHPKNNCELIVYSANLNQIPNALASQFYTSIDANGEQLIGSHINGKATDAASLNDIFSTNNANPIHLISLDSGKTRTLNWIVTFNHNAGNIWQNGLVVFDMDLRFSCRESQINNDDSDDDDDDDDGDDEDDDNDDDDNNHNNTVNTVIKTVTRYVRPIAKNLSLVAGTSTTAPEPTPSITPTITRSITPEVVTESPQDQVLGESNNVCVDPWWWWVFLAAQLLLGFGYALIISKEDLKSRTRYYFSSIIINCAAFIIYFLYFCPWYDYYLAAIIGIFMLILMHIKFVFVNEPDKFKKSP